MRAGPFDSRASDRFCFLHLAGPAQGLSVIVIRRHRVGMVRAEASFPRIEAGFLVIERVLRAAHPKGDLRKGMFEIGLRQYGSRTGLVGNGLREVPVSRFDHRERSLGFALLGPKDP